VAPPDLLRLPRLVELLQRELADRLEQRVPLLAETHQALLDERLERVEIRAGHLLGSVERPAPEKTPKRLKAARSSGLSSS
jgi:hypothetical protein